MLTKNVDLKGKTILVTGVAGFIGANLAKRLLQDTSIVKVVGIDNMNDYYDVRLKEERLKELRSHTSFIFVKGDISDKAIVTNNYIALDTTVYRNERTGRFYYHAFKPDQRRGSPSPDRRKCLHFECEEEIPENEMEICKHTLLMMLENINNRRDKNDKNTAFTSETI